MTKFITVDDRIINLDQVLHAAYNPAATNPAAKTAWSELVISFAQADECTVLYGEVATKFWDLLKLHSFDLETATAVALKPID